MPDTPRGFDQTRNQILFAPPRAVYVCVSSSHAIHCRRWAWIYKRTDLQFVTPDAAEVYIRGSLYPVIVDHEVESGRLNNLVYLQNYRIQHQEVL